MIVGLNTKMARVIVSFSIALTIFFGQIYLVTAYHPSPCSKDSDCRATGEKCSRIERDIMGCSKSFCHCPKGTGYDYQGTACLPLERVGLGESCTMFGKFFGRSMGFETHILNAGCHDPKDQFAALSALHGHSTCDDGFTEVDSSCKYNLGKVCEENSDCGSNSAQMSCVDAKCQCSSGFKLNVETGFCDFVDAGDHCDADSDCWPLGQMLARQGDGARSYSCLNRFCACNSGYQLASVNDIYLDHIAERMKVRSASYCFPTGNGNKFGLGAGQNCNVKNYSPESAKFGICWKDYGCYQCPEDFENLNKFTCRLIPSANKAIIDSVRTKSAKNSSDTKSWGVWLVWIIFLARLLA